MKLIKKLNDNTYVDKNGKTRKYVNYFLVFENGKSIQIRPCFPRDTKALDFMSEFHKKEVK